MQQAAEECADKMVGPQQNGKRDSMMLGDILGLSPAWVTMTLNQDNKDDDHRLLQIIKSNYKQDPLTQAMLAIPITIISTSNH
jgi:hypothetical protein